MNGLQTARDAIEAELKNARAGAAHYEAMAAKLEATLASLNALEGVPARAKPTRARQKRTVAAPKKGMGRPGKRAAKVDAAAGELPFTGGDFWINLINEQPKTARDILKGAVDSLGFAPTKEQVKKLSSRMIFALRALVASKKVQDSGAGRERVYFRKA